MGKWNFSLSLNEAARIWLTSLAIILSSSVHAADVKWFITPHETGRGQPLAEKLTGRRFEVRTYAFGSAPSNPPIMTQGVLTGGTGVGGRRIVFATSDENRVARITMGAHTAKDAFGSPQYYPQIQYEYSYKQAVEEMGILSGKDFSLTQTFQLNWFNSPLSPVQLSSNKVRNLAFTGLFLRAPNFAPGSQNAVALTAASMPSTEASQIVSAYLGTKNTEIHRRCGTNVAVFKIDDLWSRAAETFRAANVAEAFRIGVMGQVASSRAPTGWSWFLIPSAGGVPAKLVSRQLAGLSYLNPQTETGLSFEVGMKDFRASSTLNALAFFCLDARPFMTGSADPAVSKNRGRFAWVSDLGFWTAAKAQTWITDGLAQGVTQPAETCSQEKVLYSPCVIDAKSFCGNQNPPSLGAAAQAECQKKGEAWAKGYAPQSLLVCVADPVERDGDFGGKLVGQIHCNDGSGGDNQERCERERRARQDAENSTSETNNGWKVNGQFTGGNGAVQGGGDASLKGSSSHKENKENSNSQVNDNSLNANERPPEGQCRQTVSCGQNYKAKCECTAETTWWIYSFQASLFGEATNPSASATCQMQKR